MGLHGPVLAPRREDTASSSVNDRAAERECERERLVREIAELKAERELQPLREERDKALESIAQSKATHACSTSLEQLGDPPAPKRAAIENTPMPLRSTILPEPYHGKDMAEHTNYIRTCGKIFRCDSGRHPSDLDKVNFAAQYLRGSVDTAWEKHLQSVDLATITWQSYKSFLSDLVATLGMRQEDSLARYNAARKRPNQTVAAFVAYMDELNALLPNISDERHALTIRTALDYPIRCRFPTDEPRPLTLAWVIRTATAIEVQLRQIETEKHLQKDAKNAKTGNNPPCKRQDSDESNGQSHRRDRRENDRSEGGSKPGQGRGKGGGNKSQKAGKGKKPRTLGRYRLNGDPKGSRKEADPDACFTCGKKGHWASDCRRGKSQASEGKGKDKAQ